MIRVIFPSVANVGEDSPLPSQPPSRPTSSYLPYGIKILLTRLNLSDKYIATVTYTTLTYIAKIFTNPFHVLNEELPQKKLFLFPTQ